MSRHPHRPDADQKPANPQPHPGQWRHAAALWHEYLAEPVLPQLDRWLKQRLARSKQFGKRDRLIYADLLFDAMRFGYWAAFVMEHPNLADDNADENANDEALQAYARQYASTTIIKKRFAQPGDFADAIRFLTLCHWRAHPDQTMPQELGDFAATISQLRQQAVQHPGSDWALLWHGIPLSHQQALSQRINHDQWSDNTTARFLQAQDSRPPLWLRVNHEDERADVLQELRTQYTVVEKSQGIAITGERGVFGLECYKNGAIAIQDLASQQLAARVDCKPGDKVWDACAGGGGKTLALAARLNNRGSIWASDIREHKLDEIKRRAALSRFYNIRTAVWRGDAALEAPKEIAKQGGFDWVLVDAPCSSSGTWRRNPDARLRSLDDDLTGLNALQLQLLTHAAKNVRASGKLVYGTCSFHTCENEDVVAQFLQQQELQQQELRQQELQHNPGWQLLEQTLLGCPFTDSDTMFVAVLQRQSDNSDTGTMSQSE